MKLMDRFNGVKFIAVKGILTVNFFSHLGGRRREGAHIHAHISKILTNPGKGLVAREQQVFMALSHHCRFESTWLKAP